MNDFFFRIYFFRFWPDHAVQYPGFRFETRFYRVLNDHCILLSLYRVSPIKRHPQNIKQGRYYQNIRCPQIHIKPYLIF